MRKEQINPRFRTIRKAANIWLPYLFVFAMALVGIMALKSIISQSQQIKPKPVQYTPPVTRSAHDSAYISRVIRQQQETAQLQQQQEASQKVDWGAVSSMIVAVVGALLTLVNKINASKNTEFRAYVEMKFGEIQEYLVDVKDYQHRRDIESVLSQIEFDASGLTDSQQVKDLIEGISARARSIVRDSLTHSYTDDSYQKTMMKIGARIAECKNQAKDLGFSSDFQTELDIIRCGNLGKLKTELQRLANDNVYNDKYARSKDIYTRFLKSFLKDVIKAHYALSNKSGGAA